MQQGSGFLLVLAGLLLLWVVVSGKFDLAETFFLQLFDFPLPTNAAINPGPDMKTTLPGITATSPVLVGSVTATANPNFFRTLPEAVRHSFGLE